jgi:hypothetical protein
LNDIGTFVDNVGLVDVTETDTWLCLSSVSFPNIILNDIGTLVFNVGRMASSTQQWDYITMSVMVPNTDIQHFQCHWHGVRPVDRYYRPFLPDIKGFECSSVHNSYANEKKEIEN